MSLSQGTKIGPYTVGGLIGQGGMGEVYRARDTKLDRDVALKVLPEAFTSDPDRLARFEREAKVLASLNHPNIGSIYGLEEAEGVKALVLELVEGPTLADRIKQGAIPIDEALPIARQIADALEAAHERGVIHRDLKPANIKVKDDGLVKVLDFGLAKALQPDASDLNLSMSPTISLTAAATQMGMVLGTAAYMSPEQASGKAVDKRADVWAFGVVLYEMLTGTRPFVGDDVSKTLARVIDREPDWSALPKNTPVVLGSYLRICLEKNPKKRIRDIGDVRLVMEGAFETTIGTSAAPATETSLRVGQRPVSLVLGGLALLLVGGGIVWSILAGSVSQSTTTPRRFTITLPASDTLPTGIGTIVALSPDGRTLVYGASRDGNQQLYRRAIDEFTATPIAGTEGGREPAISPDGEWLIYRVGTGGAGRSMRKVPLRGGPVQTLVELPQPYRGTDWRADDQILMALNDSYGLMQVPESGGEASVVATPEEGTRFAYPQVLPGADAILVTVTTAFSVDVRPSTGDLHALVRGEQRLVLPDAAAGRVLSSGHLVFLRSGALWAVPFDTNRLEILSTPVPVVEGVRLDMSLAAQFTVSNDGSLAYVPRGTSGERELLSIDQNGVETRILTGQFETLDLSPDGRRVVLGTGDDSGNADVWVSNLARGDMIRLTTDPAFDGAPLWSPDGRRVVFTTTRNGQAEVMWTLADGTGTPETLAIFEGSGSRPVAYDFSPDGTTLLVATGRSGDNQGDIGIVTIEGGDGWRPLIQTEADERTPTVSPNGRWFAYASNETGNNEVYVERFPDGGNKRVVSIAGGHTPSWSADGQALVYLRSPNGPADAVMRVSFEGGDGNSNQLRIGSPEVLFNWSYFGMPGGQRTYAMSATGDRFFVIGRGADQGVPGQPQINIVLNWFEELKERVPVP